MNPAVRSIQLSDGRQLAYAEFGDPQGIPTLYCHGFPGSRLEGGLFQRAAQQKHLRFIAADRNGLGRSDPKPGRRLIDWVWDVEALIDSLGIQDFFLIGISGGGPYALACAHHFGTRLKGCTLVCPLGPLEDPMLLHSMHWTARINFQSIRSMPQLWDFAYRFSIVPLAQHWPQWIYQMMLGMVPAADRQVLKRPEVRSLITGSLREAIRQGAGGVLREMKLYTEAWGFPVADIDIPINLWHGTADETVPIIHAQTLASRLPKCKTHYLDSEGHFSLPINHADRILEELVSQPSGAGTGQ